MRRTSTIPVALAVCIGAGCDPTSLGDVTPTSLPPGVEGQPYAVTFHVQHENARTRWSTDQGTRLPAGLALDQFGRLTGIPSEHGTFALRVRAGGPGGPVSQPPLPPPGSGYPDPGPMPLEILPAPTVLSLTGVSPSLGALGTAVTLTLSGTGFVAPLAVLFGAKPPLTPATVATGQVTVDVPAGYLDQAGTVNVAVSQGATTTGGLPFEVRNPAPVLTPPLAPSSTTVGQTPALVISGSGFLQGATAYFGATPVAVTTVTATQVTIAALPPGLTAAAAHFEVTVQNPAPTVGSSNALPFDVGTVVPPPAPGLNGLSPASVLAGAPDTPVVLTGSGFQAGASVLFGLVTLVPSAVSATEITVAVPATSLLAGRGVGVSVKNPDLGVSNVLTFDVLSAAPQAIALEPGFAGAGAPAFDLAVLGGGFNPASEIWIAGARAVSAQPGAWTPARILATVPAAAILHPGPVEVFVRNPAPGGGTSGTLLLAVLGQTQIVTATPGGVPGNAPSYRGAAMSATGRAVAFTSGASDLVSTRITPGGQQVFLRDTCVGATGCTPGTELVSRDVSAAAAGGETVGLSDDGVRVAFLSLGGNLVAGYTPALGQGPQLYVRTAGVTQLASLSSAGDPLWAPVTEAALSRDGHRVAFVTRAAATSPGTSIDGSRQVYLGGLCTPPCAPGTVLISLGTDGLPANAHCASPAADFTGARVAFESAATNLVTGVDAGVSQVYVSHVATGTFTVASVDSAGAPGAAPSGMPALSADGRFVAFLTQAALDPVNDANGTGDVYLRDTCVNAGAACTPSTVLVSVAPGGATASGGTLVPHGLSADGRFVLFQVGTGGHMVRDTCAGATGCTPSTHQVSLDPDGVLVEGIQGALSGDGRWAVYGFTAPQASGQLGLGMTGF